MARAFTATDEGMKVMTADGDVIGTVESVEGDRAHVRPESTLQSAVRQKLGWTDESESMYTLENSRVDEFTDEGIRLNL